MLVLSRHRDESVIIGDDVIVTIVAIKGDKVRLGFTAPDSVVIDRAEVRIAKVRDAQAEGDSSDSTANDRPAPRERQETHPMAVGLTQQQTRWWETATRHEPADGPVAAVCLKLPDRPEAKVRAYATVELSSGYVIRDVRLVETRPGVLAVMSPNRKLADRCPCCCRRTPLPDAFCGGCGTRLGDPHTRAATLGLERQPTPGGYVADVLSPIRREARERLHAAVLAAYRKALAGA